MAASVTKMGRVEATVGINYHRCTVHHLFILRRPPVNFFDSHLADQLNFLADIRLAKYFVADLWLTCFRQIFCCTWDWTSWSNLALLWWFCCML